MPDVAMDVLVDTGRGVRGGAQALEDSFLDVELIKNSHGVYKTFDVF